MHDFFDRIDRLTDAESIALNERYGTHNYHPLPVNIVRAEGEFAFDGSGNRYIDCVGSYSAVAHGHLNPHILKAIERQVKKLTLTSRAVYTSELGVFLEELCRITQMEMASPMNTGAEAVETAIKLARKWAYTAKGVAVDKAEIIACEDNFHGRTTTIISFTTEENYKKNFGPFGPGFPVVKFGDLAALESAITPNTAAVLIEPIQAEGGILIPPDGYLAGVRRLCDKHNVLLIWDEIQTGFGRTGKDFAWQHEDARPDMICLGKALGGGVYPVAAVAGLRHVMEVFKPGDHGSTFGGNPLACAIGLAAIESLEQDGLTARSAELGELLKSGLEALNHPLVIDVRGRGLLVGMEIRPDGDGKRLASEFLKNGILTKETRHHTFRFAPPLTISKARIGEIIERTKAALDASLPAKVN